MGLIYSQPACQAAYRGDVQRLYQLLKEDVEHLNAPERYNGDTPLIAACRGGHRPTVQYLLDNHAKVHLTNKKQRTCLHYVSKRCLSVLDYLMITILMPILLLGYFLLLQKQRQRVKLMEVVLSSDVDVNAVDYKGNTALHYVVQRKSFGLVPLLLRENADLSIRNQDGETALDIAYRLRFNKIIVLLKTQ